MPEVQTAQQSGEMAQRFVSFVLMHAQQTALFLGEIPHPETGKTLKNLDGARFLIDQLEMIHEKTRGNLSAEEEKILREVLADLRLGYVRAMEPTAENAPPQEVSPPVPSEQPSATPPETADEDGRKKFTKSYG